MYLIRKKGKGTGINVSSALGGISIICTRASRFLICQKAPHKGSQPFDLLILY